MREKKLARYAKASVAMTVSVFVALAAFLIWCLKALASAFQSGNDKSWPHHKPFSAPKGGMWGILNHRSGKLDHGCDPGGLYDRDL